MSTDPMAATPSPSSYPIRFDVQYPEKLNRWLNNPFLLFIKFILAIPHLIILYILGLIAGIIFLIVSVSVVFTGKYPQGMFNFVVGVHRWQANASAYLAMMRDDYPPFSSDAGKYPVTYEADYPESISRWMNFLLLIWIKLILLIPHFIVLLFLTVAYYVVFIVAAFAILFTGKYPRGMFDFAIGVHRWSLRVNAYAQMLTDKYPPFSLKP